MNPYLQQQQPHVPQAQPQQYAQQSFQQMQQSYRLPVSYQATAGWAPQPFVMPRYQYPYHMGQVPLQVPVQQLSSIQAANPSATELATESATGSVPPLPASEPPPEPAPLPPPPDNLTVKPAPPPPDEEPSYENRTHASNFQVRSSMPSDFPSARSSNEQKGDVSYKTAISSLAASTHSGSSNEDLEELQNQQKELENKMKNYQSDYEKWFKEFSMWKKQHESHPDQRKYIEYQQKYQKLIEQQQQALKQQYLELQNRIKKKKEDDTGALRIGHQLQPNFEHRQREELPLNPPVSHVVSQPYSVTASYASMDDPKVFDHSRSFARTESQPVHSAYHPQISPFQGSRKNFDVQSSYAISRPNEDNQGLHSWQKQEMQDLPVSHGNFDQSSNIHPASQGQYQEPSSQQSNLPHYQFMSQEKGNIRHQEPSLLQSHAQPSLFSKYQDSSKQEREMLYASSVNRQQTFLSQTPASQPNAPSQTMHTDAQTNLQSQNLLHTKSQGHQMHQSFHNPPQSYSGTQKLADQEPSPSPSSKYQSFHNPPQSYLHNQKLADHELNPSPALKYQSFHNPPQSFSHNQKQAENEPGPSPSSKYQSFHNPPQSYSHNQKQTESEPVPAPSSKYQSFRNPPQSYSHNQRLADREHNPTPPSKYQSFPNPPQSYSHNQKQTESEPGPVPASKYQSFHNPPQSYSHNQKQTESEPGPVPASKYQRFNNPPQSYSRNQKLADHEPGHPPSSKYQSFQNPPQNKNLVDNEPSPSPSSKYESFHEPPQSYLHSQKLQSHDPTSASSKYQSHHNPPQGLHSHRAQGRVLPPSTSRYQGPHNPTHLNQKLDVNMAANRFQNTFQQPSTHSQQMKPDNKSGLQHKESRFQQQTFRSQQRMSSNVDRSETQEHQSNIAKHPQSMYNQRMPKPERIQSQQDVKNKPIPSLMSQEIIRKDHYDAHLDFNEEEDLAGEEEIKSTKQVHLVKAEHSRAEELRPVESMEELKGNVLRSASVNADNFASDDITGVEDWESEAGMFILPF